MLSFSPHIETINSKRNSKEFKCIITMANGLQATRSAERKKYALLLVQQLSDQIDKKSGMLL